MWPFRNASSKPSWEVTVTDGIALTRAALSRIAEAQGGIPRLGSGGASNRGESGDLILLEFTLTGLKFRMLSQELHTKWSSFSFGLPTPDAELLPGTNGVVQAVLPHRADVAPSLGQGCRLADGREPGIGNLDHLPFKGERSGYSEASCIRLPWFEVKES